MTAKDPLELRLWARADGAMPQCQRTVASDDSVMTLLRRPYAWALPATAVAAAAFPGCAQTCAREPAADSRGGPLPTGKSRRGAGSARAAGRHLLDAAGGGDVVERRRAALQL